MMGLLASIGLQILLTLHHHGWDVPLPYPCVWETIFFLIVCGGGSSIILAFLLLGICIQELNRNPNAQPLETISAKGVIYPLYGV